MEDWKKALKDIRTQLATSASDSQRTKPVREIGSTKVIYGTVTRPLKRGAGSKNMQGSQQRTGQPVQATPKPVKAIKAMTPDRPAPVSLNRPVQTSPSSVHPAIAARSPEGPVSHPKPVPVPEIITPRRPGVLSRRSWFRSPAEWVEKGARVQLAAPGQKRRAIDVVIGLDFGTSYTKAAVGMLDKIYPVTWEWTAALPDPYLLPSEYTIGTDGSVVLGQHPDANAAQVRQDLKLPFLSPGVSAASVASAAMFIGSVLRYIRAWIFEKHATKIGDATIRWYFNVGVPSNGLEDERLESAYYRLGCISWLLSESVDPISIPGTEAVMRAWSAGGRPDSLQDLSVAPEFVAQIAGYVQSPQRISGLHALVDVGGGTMDVATFIVHQIEGDDTFPFLVPTVKALGTQMLIQNRLVGLQLNDDKCLPDYLSPIAETTEFAAQTGISESHIRQRDTLFSEAVQKAVHGVFLKTRSTRYRLSDAWSLGLRTFVTGGGATACGYVNAVKEGGRRVAKSIDIMHLPFHPRLADFVGTQTDYQRISVACGLAQDAFSLGRIIPAKEVEDDTAMAIPVAKRYSHEDIYGR